MNTYVYIYNEPATSVQNTSSPPWPSDRTRGDSLESAMQLLINSYRKTRFAQVPQRVSMKSFVVLFIANSKSNHFGAQGTFYHIRSSLCTEDLGVTLDLDVLKYTLQRLTNLPHPIKVGARPVGHVTAPEGVP